MSEIKEWYCEICGDHLNSQKGFEKELLGVWRCTKCKFVNEIMKKKTYENSLKSSNLACSSKKNIQEILKSKINELTEDEKRVIILRYGLNHNKEKSLQDILFLLSNSIEDIEELEAEALRKLRR